MSREQDWIEWIRSRARVDDSFPIGVGDDAALWVPSAGMSVVMTVDTQAEGTHFRREWIDFDTLGRRAVAASASDLAAMAARPAALLVAILAPADLDGDAFRELFSGIETAARELGAQIAGGNISLGPLSETITALGECPPGRAITRSGARIGDEIWVTGSPGMARLGLSALAGEVVASAELAPAIAAYRSPRARCAEAIFLRDHWTPTAMLDLSDGLGSDLAQLVRASAAPIGAEIDASAIATSPLAELAARAGVDPIELAVAGGDDYELCWTARPDAATRGTAAFRAAFATPIARIGRIIEEPGVWLQRGSSREAVSVRGFEH